MKFRSEERCHWSRRYVSIPARTGLIVVWSLLFAMLAITLGAGCTVKLANPLREGLLSGLKFDKLRESGELSISEPDSAADPDSDTELSNTGPSSIFEEKATDSGRSNFDKSSDAAASDTTASASDSDLLHENTSTWPPELLAETEKVARRVRAMKSLTEQDRDASLQRLYTMTNKLSQLKGTSLQQKCEFVESLDSAGPSEFKSQLETLQYLVNLQMQRQAKADAIDRQDEPARREPAAHNANQPAIAGRPDRPSTLQFASHPNPLRPGQSHTGPISFAPPAGMPVSQPHGQRAPIYRQGPGGLDSQIVGALSGGPSRPQIPYNAGPRNDNTRPRNPVYDPASGRLQMVSTSQIDPIFTQLPGLNPKPTIPSESSRDARLLHRTMSQLLSPFCTMVYDTAVTQNAHPKNEVIRAVATETVPIMPGVAPLPNSDLRPAPSPQPEMPTHLDTSRNAASVSHPAQYETSIRPQPQDLTGSASTADSAESTSASSTSSSAGSNASSNPVTQIGVANEVGVVNKIDFRDDIRPYVIEIQRRLAESDEISLNESQQLRLRMLHLIAGDREGAMRPIPGMSPAMQEYWSKQFYGLATLLDTTSIPNQQERIGIVKQALDEATRELQKESPLVIRNAKFVQGVINFGRYTQFERYEFTRGQQVYIYAELQNFVSRRLEKEYNTAIRSEITIRDRNGLRLFEYDCKIQEENTQSPRNDYYFASNVFTMPDHLLPGTYALELMFTDVNAEKHKSKSTIINFDIVMTP